MNSDRKFNADIDKKESVELSDKAQEENEWGNICGCLNGSSILTQQGLPINCACITNDYDKKYAPGGGGNNTTVVNTFQKIKVYDVNEAEKKIFSIVKLHYRWKDDRISITFPSNKSTIVIAKYSPEKLGHCVFT